jgi:hypothetical protein
LLFVVFCDFLLFVWFGLGSVVVVFLGLAPTTFKQRVFFVGGEELSWREALKKERKRLTESDVG